MVRNVEKFKKLWSTNYFEIFVRFVDLHYGHYRLNESVDGSWMKERGIKLCGVKFWVHIFSGLFGSAVDKRTRNN